MHTRITLLALICSLPVLAQASTTLQGVVLAESPFAWAQVSIIDSAGQRLATQTDSEGRYEIGIDSLTPPLTLSAVAKGVSEECLRNNVLRARCMASLVMTVDKDAMNTANITPFSDRLVSEVAGELGYICLLYTSPSPRD